MAKELFGSLPGKARWAANGLLTAGLLWLAIAATIIYSVRLEADAVQKWMIGYCLLISLTSLTAMVLLLCRKSVGRILAWIVVPLIVAFFPIGTLLGAAVIVGLLAPELKDHLKKT